MQKRVKSTIIVAVAILAMMFPGLPVARAVASPTTAGVSAAADYIRGCEALVRDGETKAGKCWPPSKSQQTKIDALNAALAQPVPRDVNAEAVSAYKTYLKARVAYESAVDTEAGGALWGGIIGGAIGADCAGGGGLFTTIACGILAAHQKTLNDLKEGVEQALQDVHRVEVKLDVVLIN